VPVQLIKAWSISPNIRNPFTTMADMVGWFIFKNHQFLITKGWVVVGTSNGSTAGFDGPGTDRIISAAAAGTQGASAAAPQSWSLLGNTDGVQLLITYQGASTHIARISYSPGGLFIVAGTPTHQPTATDEMVVSTGNTVVDATASLDRVMTIWASDDSKHWMVVVLRNSAQVLNIGVERVTDITGTTGVFSVPYVGYRWSSYGIVQSALGTSPTSGPSITAFGATGWFGCAARVFTAAAFRVTRIGCGSIFLASTPDGFTRAFGAMFNDNPPLQGALEHPLVTPFWNGEGVVNLEGFVAAPIDFYYAYTASLTVTPAYRSFYPGWEPGDTPGVTPPRTNWMIAFGPAMVRPWRDAAPTLEIL
jgi:hypothetical protein